VVTVDGIGTGTVDSMTETSSISLVVRLWLPDRPGALGQVASRIGGVRGDVIGIEILERGAGQAIDELMVSVPSEDLIDLLVAEIGQVDGVSVEDVRRVDPDRPDHGVMALEIAAEMVETDPCDRLAVLCERLLALTEADWCAAASFDPPTVLVDRGSCPDPQWLNAFLEGARHLPADDIGAATPSDVAWAYLPRAAAAVAVGRAGWSFRSRERQMVHLLGRLADHLLPAAHPT
jgi:hypothetical protein